MGLRRRRFEIAVAAVLRAAVEGDHPGRRRRLRAGLFRRDRHSRAERQHPARRPLRELTQSVAMTDRGAARNRVDRALADAVAAGHVPGVAAAAADDSGVVYEGAFGRRELGKDTPMTSDTVFRIASMTKA